jgi:predicted short-subunit dehydrogenase-like oxidoreductase (DUF2520 family)
MPKRPSLAIIGCGRAGGSIAIALERAGYTLAGVWSRSPAGRRRASRLLRAPVVSSIERATRSADIAIVAVPDDAIAAVADSLGAVPIAVHTSGATSVRTLRRPGRRAGSIHPLQSLPDARRGADALRGAAVAVTCEPADRVALFRIAAAWGGRPFALADEHKARYHAAAVFASNYIVTSVWAASEILAGSGIDPAVLHPLVRSTVANVIEMGPARAITGPAARGDAGTLRRHMRALGEGPVREAYRAMARLTTALAR